MAVKAELNVPLTPNEFADQIGISRGRELTIKYGTSFRAGENPAEWKPYHTQEYSFTTTLVERLFLSALEGRSSQALDPMTRSMLVDLHAADLPSMSIATSLFYPDFDDLYGANSSLAIEKMGQSGIFRPRDFEIVDVVINEAIVKRGPGEPLEFKEIVPGTPYSAHRKIYVDAMRSFKDLPDGVFLVGLHAVEKLIENKKIHTKEGNLPTDLRQVINPSTEYDHQVFSEDISWYSENIFGRDKNFMPELLTSMQFLPHFSDNQRYFQETVQHQLDSSTITIPDFLRGAWEFAEMQRSLKK